jgi:8-oxo-dGTP pyrophosphatase MutT (NUDIX family)
MVVSSASADLATNARSPGAGRVPGFAKRVAECNEITPADVAQKYVPLVVDGQGVGLMRPAFAADLVKASEGVFALCRRLDESESSESSGLDDGDVERLTPDETARLLAGDPAALLATELCVTLDASLAGDTERTRSAAVAPVMERLRDAGVVTGWRDELFPVNSRYGEPPALLVERATASLLGIRAYGVHINGYVCQDTHKPFAPTHLWVARRSATKPTFPSALDHLVAGGLPANMDPGACAIKECEEEASVPVTLSSLNLVSAGCVTYNSDYLGCCKRDVLFCYDLRLPEDFVPKPNDGEVESFALVPVDEACRLVAETKEFKPNVALVLVDFFVRHGIVTPEEPGYVELVKALRR